MVQTPGIPLAVLARRVNNQDRSDTARFFARLDGVYARLAAILGDPGPAVPKVTGAGTELEICLFIPRRWVVDWREIDPRDGL